MNSLEKLQLLHPSHGLRELATECYNKAVQATPKGVHPVIDQTYRTFAESDALYQQGRTKPGQIVSNAQAGHSWHNYGLALDFHLVVNGKDIWDVNHDWMTVVNIFKDAGFTWGGDFVGSFKDYPHLEIKFGHTIVELLQMHKDGKFIPGTEYLDI